MSTLPKILNTKQIKDFENPPILKNEERKILFNLDESINNELLEIEDDKNKLLFIILFGYFKHSKKFFSIDKFNYKDINYVTNKYNLKTSIDEIKFFSRSTIFRYKKIILNYFLILEFNDTKKELLIKELKEIIKVNFNFRRIFENSLKFLNENKIEIPSYNILAGTIAKVINEYEKEISLNISNLLDDNKKELLEELLKKIKVEEIEGKNYKLTKLKRFSYSTKKSKIDENIESLKIFKNIFENTKDIIEKINLSSETIEYYALYTLKSDINQLKIKNDTKKYLHLISFITYQYFNLQDLLVDIFLSVIKTAFNSAKRENIQTYYNNKKKNEEKISEIVNSYKEDNKLIANIIKIISSNNLSSEEKLKEIENLVNKIINKNRVKIENNINIIENETKSNLKDQDLYKTLDINFKKINNKVNNILKLLEFDTISSNKKLIEAINSFKNKIIKPSLDFIEDTKKLECLYNEKNEFQISMYKIFLFQEVSNSIKSGSLNLQYSYRYKSINDYLIQKEFWRNNKEELIKKAGLSNFQDSANVIKKLKQILDQEYNNTNKNILNKSNLYINFKNLFSYTLSTPNSEESETPSVSELFTGQENISLTSILNDISKITSFLDNFEHHNLKYAKQKPKDNVFFAGIIGYGCNIGKNKIAKISKGINEYELENSLKYYFNLNNTNSANNKILSFIESLDLPNIYKRNKDKNHTSSDGQKYILNADSVTGNYSYKYFGSDKGISIYTFIDERHLLFYSTVISASEREAGYVIDGLMNNDVIKSDIHSTDTHGYTEMIFGITHLLGYSFAPRIKNFKEKILYCFDSFTKNYYIKNNYRILPNSPKYINTKVIEENWDDVLRFIATIKLRKTSASQLLKRLSSYSKKNKLYQALNEFGKIISTIFILKYIDDGALRQSIEKQLNKIESSNKFAKAVFFGNNQEFDYVSRDEQELAESCKRLIENSIICWNYLYLSHKISIEMDFIKREEILKTIKNGSIIFWKHINLLGEYNFSENFFNKKIDFDIHKILELKI